MAKFYQRYLPPAADLVVQYGYRGGNYTVNGQFYCTSNNVEQVGNYQYTCAASYCAAGIAPIAAGSMFEPSLGLQPFDSAGSRFSGDYARACFSSYSTYQNSSNLWSFRNQSWQMPAIFCVQDTTAVSCLCGCVMGSSVIASQCTLVLNTCANANTTACCTYGSAWQTIEHPANTFQFIVPHTWMGQGICTSNVCCPSCLCNNIAVNESTFGTANVTSAPRLTYSCAWPGAPAACTLYSNAMEVKSTGHCFPFNIHESNANDGDGYYFGTTDNSNLYAGGPCIQACTKVNYVFGTSLHTGCSGNAVEYGSRIFLANLAPYTYYMHFNSVTGGIQGTDTMATGATGNRLKLKMYSSSNQSTNTIYNMPKGLGGYITPSNPDFDGSTTGTVYYRFYTLQFTGADMPSLQPSSTGSIAISRIQLTNLGTVSSSTYRLMDSAGSNQMLASDMAQIYTWQGYNNTYLGQLNNMGVRRQTVHRVWISFDANSVKRLHMGVYNTNGTTQITAANGFNLVGNRGDMFNIYSWELDDNIGVQTAKYKGKVSTAQWAPRYFCPLDPGNVTLAPTPPTVSSITPMWNILYIGCTFSNDIIMTLNATTGLYQYQNTMPYVAARLFKDKDSRWCAQVYDGTIVNNGYQSNYIDVITSDVGQTISLTTTATSFVYTGTTVSSSIQVNVFNYLGARVVKTVSLSVVGQTANPGITFNDGTYFTNVTSSASTDTTVAIYLISSAYAKIVGTVAEI